MDTSAAEAYTDVVRDWWEAHPFTLGLAASSEKDTDLTGRIEDLDEAFFANVDRKMRKFCGTSGQAEGAPLLSSLVPYDSLKGKCVLDIAVGSGWTCVTLAEQGACVYGIDLTKEAIRMSQRHAELKHVSVDLKLMDAQRLEFADGFFDYTLAWGCLMHMPDTERALREINRTLVSGGRTLAYMYNKSSWTYWFNFFLLRGVLKGDLIRLKGNTTALVSKHSDGAPTGGNMLTKAYSPREITKMFEKAGFSNVKAWPFYIPHEVDGWPMAKFPFFRHLPISMKVWLGKRFAWGMIVTAEKR